MLAITPQMRIFVAMEPVDFRKQIDSLAAVCRERLGEDPFSGAVFVFRPRSGKSLKLLMYDGQGFWLCQKRLSKGRLKWWPSLAAGDALDSRHRMLAAQELQVLLWNGDPQRVRMAGAWRGIEPSSRLHSVA